MEATAGFMACYNRYSILASNSSELNALNASKTYHTKLFYFVFKYHLNPYTVRITSLKETIISKIVFLFTWSI